MPPPPPHATLAPRPAAGGLVAWGEEPRRVGERNTCGERIAPGGDESWRDEMWDQRGVTGEKETENKTI
jgi:hypothetical protein